MHVISHINIIIEAVNIVGYLVFKTQCSPFLAELNSNQSHKQTTTILSKPHPDSTTTANTANLFLLLFDPIVASPSLRKNSLTVIACMMCTYEWQHACYNNCVAVRGLYWGAWGWNACFQTHTESIFTPSEPYLSQWPLPLFRVSETASTN